MFIMKKVFDPELQGKAVYLTTNKIDAAGVYIVSYVDNEDLHLVDHTAIVSKYHTSFFDVEENDLQVLEIPIVKMETLPELPFDDIEDPPVKPHKTDFTRNQGSRNIRSDLQIKVDNAHVEYILKSNIEPLKLEEIIKRMQLHHGHWHWNKNNGSGFIQHAIKLGKKIKKVEYGVYGYDWEAGE